MDWPVVVGTFVGALAGSVLGILVTLWLTISARKSAARSQRRTERHLEGINGSLQKMAYWGGFDAERQVEADMEAARAKIGTQEEGIDPENRGDVR